MLLGDVTPHLDLAEKLIHIFGIPGVIGAIVWLARVYERGTQQLRDIDEGTKIAIKTTAEVKSAVDTIQNNHMAHLAEELKGQTGLLTSMDKNLAILADRLTRGV